MVYNYFISILIFTCSLLIIPIAFSIVDTQLSYKCLPSNTAFTNDYNQSRALMVIDLINNTASSEGFRNASFAWPLQDPDEWTYGLALCRGDVSPDECKTCVNNAAQTVIDADHCPDSRAAIIWRAYCFVKYSDIDFFGKIDTDNRLNLMGGSMWSQTTAVYNFTANLSQIAIESPKLYAYGTANINDDPSNPNHNVTVYGMTQCTRDITPRACKDCLGIATKGLVTSRQDGGILLGSCNIRYGTHNFNSSAIN